MVQRCFSSRNSLMCLKTVELSLARIHPPDVIGKYAPEAVIGKLGAGAPAAAPAAPSLAQPLLEKGHQEKNWSRSEKNREMRMKGEGKVGGWIGAILYMVLGFMKEVLFTIFPQKLCREALRVSLFSLGGVRFFGG